MLLSHGAPFSSELCVFVLKGGQVLSPSIEKVLFMANGPFHVRDKSHLLPTQGPLTTPGERARRCVLEGGGVGRGCRVWLSSGGGWPCLALLSGTVTSWTALQSVSTALSCPGLGLTLP